MEMKHWRGLLVLGIILHIFAAILMPLGLDAHVHASYVSDEMADGEAVSYTHLTLPTNREV